MGIIKRIITELKQTNWPSFDQLVKLTIYTIIFCGIIALIILGLDLILFRLRDFVLNL